MGEEIWFEESCFRFVNIRSESVVALASGAVVQARLFRQSIVIINSHKAAVELLEKKSAIYSDRPRLVMAGEL